MSDQWKKRKARELQFLKQLNLQCTNLLVDMDHPHTQKKIRAAKTARNQIDFFPSESNFSPDIDRPVRYGNHSFKYGYQRINLEFEDPFKANPYPRFNLSQKKHFAYFSFTNCGQSALSCAILAALKTYPNSSIEGQSSLYYETEEFFLSIGFAFKGQIKPRRPYKNKILIIDSSSDWHLDFDVKEYCCFIVDTTCWDLSDPIIDRVVKKLMQYKAEVILARSHIKLDCLGTEWSRLGSAMIVGQKNLKTAELFRLNFTRFLNAFGGRATVDQIYPFIQSKTFLKLTSRWVKNLKKSNQVVAQALSEHVQKNKKNLIHDLQLIQFQHQLFFWIRIDDPLFENNSKKIQKILKLLRAYGVSAAEIASYPWDFTALTAFTKKSYSNKGPADCGVIRISIPDLSAEGLKVIIKLFISWIDEQFKNLTC